ncbi:hypothetical protein AM1_G0109 (plasmid) [Acaryochloris marina MBIC11017]|uniref:Uncharacterized protein n=1 Tax=Acaryochloris marina (strain MBIC 11017) TaxID=329726 RepID=A8ZQK3_ACAM1|nr:hypothetical protein AM1_G0109 [Acaryochloris marina MBIC11017]
MQKAATVSSTTSKKDTMISKLPCKWWTTSINLQPWPAQHPAKETTLLCTLFELFMLED